MDADSGSLACLTVIDVTRLADALGIRIEAIIAVNSTCAFSQLSERSSAVENTSVHLSLVGKLPARVAGRTLEVGIKLGAGLSYALSLRSR